MGSVEAETGIEQGWRVRYAPKICTPGQAVRSIPAGRRILIGSGAAEPCRLVEAMVAEGGHLADNEILHLLTLGSAPYVQVGVAETIPAHRILHRSQRARGRGLRSGRLHAGVPR